LGQFLRVLHGNLLDGSLVDEEVASLDINKVSNGRVDEAFKPINLDKDVNPLQRFVVLD
jgi:hypothetical protein